MSVWLQASETPAYSNDWSKDILLSEPFLTGQPARLWRQDTYNPWVLDLGYTDHSEPSRFIQSFTQTIPEPLQ